MPIVSPIDTGLESRVSELEDKYRKLSDNALTSQINDAIDELRSGLVEVSDFARNLQGDIVEVKKAISVSAASPTSTGSPVQTKLSIDSEQDNIKTWGKFFKIEGKQPV